LGNAPEACAFTAKICDENAVVLHLAVADDKSIKLPPTLSLKFLPSTRQMSSPLGRYTLGVAAAWTVFIAAALTWLLIVHHQTTLDHARLQAQIGLEKNLLFFKWGTAFDSIYVREKTNAPPDHNLAHGEESFVQTQGGQQLALVNPMAMLRGVLDMGHEQFGHQSHLTSLRLFRPENAPDAWESEALKAFEHGESEASSVETMGGQTYMRVMRPIVTDESCLACHRDAGEHVGGVRGGASVSIPMAPLWAAGRREVYSTAITGSLIWLLGLAVIGYGAGRIQKENDQLALARDQAVEASRLKSEFLANMSHEIRTPMNGVLGMASLLAESKLTEAQTEYVRAIEATGEALMNIINDILDYSKIEAGRIELEVAPFDLRQCVEDALDLFSARAFEKKLELIYLMGPGVPTHVAGDGFRLRQILVNLLGNAIKFTARGEVVLTVDAEPAGDRQRLRFAIKDTGIGITADSMKRLFQSFTQVDASTTRRFGGTGLGLAISRRLAELMGGTMWAESIPGEGSTFQFTILVTPSPQLVEFNIHTNQPDVAGKRLLIVDDNETNRNILAAFASVWGMVVREAATPHAALDLLRADSGCDVAALDMQMPDMDGEELAAAIHKLPGCTQLPLLLLTSIGRRTKSADIAKTLIKPAKPVALYAAIRACLRPETKGDRPAAPMAPTYDETLGRRCPLRVLVAEDNVVNQRVINLMLQRLGYGGTTVTNGLEVLAALKSKDYDTILMDVEMPELDGREATRRLRSARGAKPDRPWIIALTASAMEIDRERAIAAGMNDFLTKPIRTDALSQALIRAHAALTASTPPTA
jgi:signal transduction histidine kinase/CheY-like chemotaxis protein